MGRSHASQIVGKHLLAIVAFVSLPGTVPAHLYVQETLSDSAFLGPPDAQAARIRGPLFATKSFGTGLGIPAVEQNAMQHGDSLEIEPNPGRGAAFTIILPTVAIQYGEAA